jgi:hypothetical protein
MWQDILGKIIHFSRSWNTMCSQRSATGQVPGPVESTTLHFLLQHTFYYYYYYYYYYYSRTNPWPLPLNFFPWDLLGNVFNVFLIFLMSTVSPYHFLQYPKHLAKSTNYEVPYLVMFFILRIWNILTMTYNTQNYWVSRLCPSSGIPGTGKENISETGSVSETLRFLVFRIPNEGQIPETQ